ncbi:MAG: TonB-dependent receptor [Gammaproteobacteria bacterium]|jgi:vitamin B12 transporter
MPNAFCAGAGALATLLLAASPAARAGDTPITASENLIVTATRTPIAEEDSLAPVIVIDRAEIERSQAGDLAELLQFHAGLAIARNGGPGAATSLFLRGTDSNHTLVLVDGVRINPGTIGGAPLQNISPDMIERVEIVKGPRSALFGSDAIGGVINIITRHPTGSRAGASVRAGQYHTREAAAHLDWRDDGANLGLAVDRTLSDGFPSVIGSDIDRGYANTSLDFHAGRTLGAGRLQLRAWQAQGTSQYLDFSLNPVSQDFTNRTVALDYHLPVNAIWTTSLNTARMIDRTDQNQSRDHAHTRRDMIDWQNELTIDGHQALVAGIYLAREHTAAASFGLDYGENTPVRAVYAEDDFATGRHHLVVAGRLTDHDAFGRHGTWNAEYGWQATDATRLSISSGTAFRAPDSTDRFGYGGNPDLAPETSRNIELGIRHNPDAGQVVSVQLFENRIVNLIEFVDPDGFAGPQPGRNENIARARIRGLEIGYRWNTDAWSWRSELSLQRPRDLDGNRYLARRPRRSLTTSLVRHFANWQLGTDLLAAGARPDSPYSNAVDAGYVLLNLTAGWKMAPGWWLRGRLENVLDTDYQTAAGYRSAGRGLYLSLAYSTD